MSTAGDKIRVLVRKRPLSKKQVIRNQIDIISVSDSQTVIVKQQKVKVDLTPFIEEYKFNFDGAYDENATNQQIYATSVRQLVDCAFDGAKVSCFAYGQTGSGKTYTMLGNGSNVRGLYLLAANDIFNLQQKFHNIDVWVSFYEIYCGKLYDLLNQKNILFARQDAKNNVNIVGLSESKIYSTDNLMQIIEYGTGIRVTSQNGTNNDSSRSHAILQITLKNNNKLHGKITFIDLAGSQRAADHADQLEKQTRIDGAQINKSLLALKECIRALDQNKHHTPFRGSKLTMVLKDSFTGYCRTVMIGNISPNSTSCQNTLNTLKYADRVKELKKPSRENFLQMQKIDQLSRELMLPRGNIKPNNKNIISKDKIVEEMQENCYNYNKSSCQSQPKYNSSKPKIINYNRKSDNRSPKAERISALANKKNSPNTQQRKYSISFTGLNSKLAHPRQQVGMLGLDMIQQQQQPTQMDLLSLSQKHDQYVQRILQSQEYLILEHQKHINQTIELTKKQMLLRDEADKIGSNIEDYLDNLDGILLKKMDSILQIRSHIKQIKQYLIESKKIQQQYSKFNKNVYQQQNQNCLLDDDDQLFIS